MAIQLEEWALNCTHILSEIFKFLDVGDLPPDDISKICLERNLNVQSMTDFKPMLNSTKQLLRDFHRPYVKELANLLQDDKFLWDY
ncbi:Carbohydrate sulfotransferase 15 [Holothuria leucospilota]|uniref:Carbohydrate sulfotransferase 15 n=1 Tax=Holothuria leucospilota TaxID=206669 RepID=A0A9Q1BF81_HOLLE|nr:Carbohydrate sulfotransferase 15 [Holothuria leucospilota]